MPDSCWSLPSRPRLSTRRRRAAPPALSHVPDRSKHPAHLGDEIVGKARFGHKGIAAGFLRAFRCARERVSGQRDDRNIPSPLVRLELPCRLPAVHPRERQIHQDQIGDEREGLLKRLVAVARFSDAKPAESQVLRVHLARILIIVNDQNQRSLFGTHWGGSRGIVSVNVEPCPRLLRSVIRPPSDVASLRQIASPSPVPPYCRDGESST